MESHKRTLVKTLTFRVIASLITIFTVYFWTKEWSVALGAALVLNLLKGIFYYVHERLWNMTNWNRRIKYKKKK